MTAAVTRQIGGATWQVDAELAAALFPDQGETLASARLAVQLVTNQYQAGVVNFLNVLTAQTSAFNSERALLDLRGRRLTAGVGLVKALGGGWPGLAADPSLE